jgi:hypothetical protein
MTRQAVVWLLMVAAGVVCGCGAFPVDSYWSGDRESDGARVYVDGKLVAILKAKRGHEGALVAPSGLEPCYDWGDTISAVGDESVGQFVWMPLGQRQVLVISAAGESLSCSAEIGDSPGFAVIMKCRALLYPGHDGRPAIVRGPPNVPR